VETDRLIRLAEDLLLLARADNAQPFLRPGPLVLPELLGAAARGAEARAAARGVTVAVHTPAELTVVADPDRLRQAVDNLLDNATRHSPPGGLVTLRAERRDEQVLFVVTDQGAGIPEADRERVFERFTRGERPTGGGTGLALAIAQAAGFALVHRCAGHAALAVDERPIPELMLVAGDGGDTRGDVGRRRLVAKRGAGIGCIRIRYWKQQNQKNEQ
jgi:signal transduction histidine kinase